MDFMKIFISYRRDDSAGYAGRLFDYLSAHFGSRNVFMDIDTIEPGDDFRKVVKNAVGTCDVVLVMIGKRWLDMTDAQGRRLEDPTDWVRVEVATALANPDVRVIPVLVRDAPMPGENELPEDLKELSWRNAIQLSDSRFQHDANKLVGVIERTIKKPRTIPAGRHLKSGRTRTWTIVLGIIGLSLVFGIILYGIRSLGAPQVTATIQQTIDSSFVWQDNFNDGMIDVDRWNLPTDLMLIFEQNGVMNFRVVGDQSRDAVISSEFESKPNQKPIREIKFKVMLNSYGELNRGALGIDVFLKDADPTLSVEFGYDGSDGPGGSFSFCPDFNAFDEDYERCVYPTPMPDEDAFPNFDSTPLQIRVISTGERIDFYGDGEILASKSVSAWIENFRFFVYAEQEATLQGIIDDLHVIYQNE
jgi:hypothetical protein